MKKYCAKCGEEIDEKKKFCMTLTKQDNKILEFEAFHFDCWKNFLKENLRMLLKIENPRYGNL